MKDLNDLEICEALRRLQLTDAALERLIRVSQEQLRTRLHLRATREELFQALRDLHGPGDYQPTSPQPPGARPA